ncbi:MAG: hypothetical protein KAH13_02140, partial [Tenericutes bacterium]|nr:hypothetical protein [Mycoplasmatota bacterium]
AVSISALAIAIAKTVLVEEKQKFLNLYAIIALSIYTILLLAGSIIESRFLISYELFIIFFMPLFLIFFIYSVIEYKRKKDCLNNTLIITWILFLIVNLSYYVYYYLGITESLYSNYNIWFSANDVLHVTLIFWMLYIQFKLKKEISNLNQS